MLAVVPFKTSVKQYTPILTAFKTIAKNKWGYSGTVEKKRKSWNP
jgi:hypothetical protein